MEGSEWLSVIIGLLHAGGHAEHAVFKMPSVAPLTPFFFK